MFWIGYLTGAIVTAMIGYTLDRLKYKRRIDAILAEFGNDAKTRLRKIIDNDLKESVERTQKLNKNALYERSPKKQGSDCGDENCPFCGVHSAQ